MNERILELARQAGLKFSSETALSPQEQKFAELIVKECIDHINYRTEDWNAKLHWIFNDDSGYMDVNVESVLKDHFNGVID